MGNTIPITVWTHVLRNVPPATCIVEPGSARTVTISQNAAPIKKRMPNMADINLLPWLLEISSPPYLPATSAVVGGTLARLNHNGCVRHHEIRCAPSMQLAMLDLVNASRVVVATSSPKGCVSDSPIPVNNPAV